MSEKFRRYLHEEWNGAALKVTPAPRINTDIDSLIEDLSDIKTQDMPDDDEEPENGPPMPGPLSGPNWPANPTVDEIKRGLTEWFTRQASA